MSEGEGSGGFDTRGAEELWHGVVGVRLAAPAAPGRDAHATALTRRERQVALLVAIGHSRADVAGLLRLTPDEVSGHLAAVRAKLRERRRLALGPLPG